jgi:hypothetical protein
MSRNLRQSMPLVTEFIDALREHFPPAEVNAAIRAGMDGQQTFWASEGGIEIGARWQPNPAAAEAEAARAVLWATAAAQRDCQRERQPQRNARGGADDRCR